MTENGEERAPLREEVQLDAPRASRRELLPFALALSAVLVSGLLFVAFHLKRERVFYYWDYQTHYELAAQTTRAFGQSLGAGLAFAKGTLGSDYNALYTLPLLPFLAVFGATRAVYLSAVFVVYHVPVFALTGAWLARLFPERRPLALGIGVVIAASLPNYWYIVLRGYPDVCGLMLIALAGLWHVRRPAGAWNLSTSLGVGLGVGGAILLRRHYAYAAVAFYLALGFDSLAVAWALGDTLHVRWRALRHRLEHLIAAAGVTLGAVALIAPGFFARANQLTSQRLYASWEEPPRTILASILWTSGVAPLLLALTGIAWFWKRRPERRSALRFLVTYASTWTFLWVFVVRQNASHYCHAIPLTVSVGVGCLLLLCLEIPRSRARGLAVLAVCALWALAFAQAASPSKALRRVARVPFLMPPRGFQPLAEPGYDQVAELVRYLNEVSPPGGKVLVAASSDALNHDLLRFASETLLHEAPPRFTVLSTAQVDSVGELTDKALYSADLVVVARPFQQHLHRDEQRVIKVLLEVFKSAWPVSKDFERLSPEIMIPVDSELVMGVRVWRRIRPTSRALQGRTSYMMAEYVAGRTVAQPEWHLVTSLLRSELSANPDGTTQIVGHPARGSERPETVFESDPVDKAELRVSGSLEFFDSRCIGSELFLTTDAPDARESSLGAFAPAGGVAKLDAKLTGVSGRRLRLIVRTHPSAREDHGHCTLSIAGLRVD